MKESWLFDIGIKEGQLQASPEVESTYSAFLDSYAKISVALEAQLNLVYSKGLEAAREDSSLEDDYSGYNSAYGKYVNKLRELLGSKQNPIQYNLEFLRFFRNAELLAYSDRFPYRRNFLMMQRVGIMAQVAGFLYQLYQANVDSSLPVFRYMEAGAHHLGYTSQKMYNRMNGAIRMKNQTNVVTSVLNSLLGKYPKGPFPPCSPFECQGIAMADYSYHFQQIDPKVVQIKPVKLGTCLLNTIYQSDCSIELGLGMQAALFSLPSYYDKVVLSFAGTEFSLSKRAFHNVITDIAQLYLGPETTYMAAVGLLKEVKSNVPADELWVVGHSLGGGLMQYACVALEDFKIHGVGYNAAGLSSYSLRTLTAVRIHKMEPTITQIRSNSDYVSNMGRQLGNVKYVDTKSKFSHSINDLNVAMNGTLIYCYI